MGTISHDALIVETFSKEAAEAARNAVIDVARSISAEDTAKFDGDWTSLVGPLMGGIVNGHVFFMIAPDGSKEGWDTSDRGDRFRQQAVEAIKALKSCVQIVTVRWGELGEQISAGWSE